jgi:polysaccharide export outer membrane protein
MLLLMLLLCPVTVPAATESVPPPSTSVVQSAGERFNYLIGPGDVLDISVWKDETLTRSVVVLPDGSISFPLIGEIAAAGKKIGDLKSELETRLARYVTDLVLTVEVKQANSLLIYVIGRVNSPGRFALNTDVTVLQALAMAGGLNPFARKNDIRILRREGGATVALPFRYSTVVDDLRLEDNITLRRGDVIVVP